MDEELKALAEGVLLNAFYEDFSALVNKYLEAAEGLDLYELEMQIGELTSVYGRDDLADAGNVVLHIWTKNGPMSSTGHQTILEALNHEPATEVHVQGEKVFERSDGEWYFVEDEG